MSYILSYNTISKANSSEKGILKTIIDNEIQEEVINPDYKSRISPMAARRMSKIVKMGVFTALEAIDERKISGIVHATGLGCLADTEKFLKSFSQSKEGILSPTPFIQSTHNTIAGQIALLLKIQEYNMTHVQNGVSFECALIDALSLSDELKGNILVGGADETAPILDEIIGHYQFDKSQFSYGASSFVISDLPQNAVAKITQCEIRKAEKNTAEVISSLTKDCELVLFGKSFFKGDLPSGIQYSKYSGVYNTNSSFGLQMGVEFLNASKIELEYFGINQQPKSVAIVNNFNDSNIGITKISKP